MTPRATPPADSRPGGRPGEHDDELDLRLARSLGRSFRPPADLGRGLARLVRAAPSASRPSVPPPAGLLAPGPWIALAASAAVVLGLALARGNVDSAGARSEGFLARIPPRTAGRPAEVLRLAPDLERLYARVSREAPRPSACRSPEEYLTSGFELANMLAARYGAAARLRPQAATLLQGPYASSEWPSATVFAGIVEGRPVVVVAELESRVACCVQVRLPRDSDLRLFPWRQGRLRLTEISPLAEPRLLQLFEP